PFGVRPGEQRGQGSVVEADEASPGSERGVKCAQECGLAAAVGPDQSHHPTAADLDPRTVEHDGIAVGERDVLRGDHESAPNVSWIRSSPSTDNGVGGSVKLNNCTRMSSLRTAVSASAPGRFTTASLTASWSPSTWSNTSTSGSCSRTCSGVTSNTLSSTSA